MNKFTIYSADSRGFLSHDTAAYYHEDYVGGQGRHNIPGTVENLICTFKNDIRHQTSHVLGCAMEALADVLSVDLPKVLEAERLSSLRVCVVPRAKREAHYRDDQRLFRETIRRVVDETAGLVDGTMDILRHTDTMTTHMSRTPSGGGDGDMPYTGITLDTCSVSGSVAGKDILLIDDLYTKTVGIDEDCIEALYANGARSVRFYSVGKTVRRF